MEKYISDLLKLANESKISVDKAVQTLTKLINSNITTLSEIVDPQDFFNSILFLSSQAKAPLIENYIKTKLNLNSVPVNINRGDGYKASINKYYEIKASTNNQRNTLNMVQIRAWQDVDYYLAVFIDELNLTNSYVFLLTKIELRNELKTMNASASHGTSSTNTDNKNIEFSLHLELKQDNVHFERWQKNYFNEEIFSKLFGKGK